MLLQAVREAHGRGDPYWAVSLVSALDRLRPVLALQWALKTLQQILNQKQTARAQEQLRLLESLQALPSPLPASRLWEMSQETWYHPQRDPAQTALSRLYAGLAHQVDGNTQAALSEVCAAMQLMCDPGFAAPAFSIALVSFEVLLRDASASGLQASASACAD